MAYISRNPFAREELHRNHIEPHKGQTCDFCGSRNGHNKLFQYYIEVDSIQGNRKVINGLFCSIGCMRIYHKK